MEALEKIATFVPHVMVTDLMMPRMNGEELLRRLKTQPGGPATIVQTAFGNLETAVATIHDLGAFWFLEKPVQSQALRLLVERAAAQGQLAEHAERLERQLGYQGVLGRNGRGVEQDAGSVRPDPAGGAEPRGGADHWRKRHR